jgi:hypothetical protein
MKLKTIIASLSFLIIFSTTVFADAGGGHKPYVGSSAFEQMKQLVGNREASMDMGQGPMTVKASYKLTSGGSALIETVFEGAPLEMVSVYHDNPDKKLTMIHFCAEHNQPRFILTSMVGNKLIMGITKDSQSEVAQQKHIHNALIHIQGKDSMVQQWTGYKGGKKDKVVEMTFKRIK